MQEINDQLFSKSPWPQYMGFSFPQSFVAQPQEMSGPFQPDQVDASINGPAVYLTDDLAHLLNDHLPSADKIIQTPESPSSQISECCSSGLDPKMAALAPAQPRLPPGGDLKLPRGPRYHKRREQNRVAQRAFRRRKEQHLKDLEDKVAVLEATRVRINAENAQLQEDLERATIEHSLLQNLTQSNSPLDCADRSERSSTSTPCREWFASPPPTSSFEPHSLVGTRPLYRGHQLNGGQIWKFIIGHHLFQQGLADVDLIIHELRRFRQRDEMEGITEDILTNCIQKSVMPRQEGYR
ncbi:hypothetical protein J3459_013674 [Metarhizium acridum]|nr:hypothetical protein J3459_018341 [Metarhizium acridum]KAG8416768.1 hypothetical protein J3459_013674 [Metarhizium acridum]